MKSVAGHWLVDIAFVRGAARHALELEQEGEALRGRYRTQYGEYPVTGALAPDGAVSLHVPVSHEHVGAGYGFGGQVTGDTMSGHLSLGEYWQATWSARLVPAKT